MADSLADLREECAGLFGKGPEYVAKQLHKLPEASVVSRERFLLERCQGKTVLDVGASGPMHAAIVQVAARCYGIDRPSEATVSSNVLGHGDVIGVDLDDCGAEVPVLDVDLVVCGEVLEHLSNPGQFLDKLRKGYACPLLVTAPNAYTEGGRRAVLRGYENCNVDHVAWHSPQTLRTLLTRAGWEPTEWYWYNGTPGFAEGIIVVAR